MNDFGLYLIITDPLLPYRTIAEICVRRGIRLLQLREKHLSDHALLKAAREIMDVTRGTETLFVFNDRPDLALVSGADGVHLGQEDIPIRDVRQLAGDRPLCYGLSTHSLPQAREALSHSPDYIGFGPIYPTPTKAIADPEVGTDALSDVLKIATVPVVAIGGIDDTNIRDVLAAGARNVCMVRYFMQARDLEQRIERMQDLIGEYPRSQPRHDHHP